MIGIISHSYCWYQVYENRNQIYKKIKKKKRQNEEVLVTHTDDTHTHSLTNSHGGWGTKGIRMAI